MTDRTRATPTSRWRRSPHTRHKRTVMQACRNRCVYCGRRLSTRTTTLDHVQPRKLAGTDDLPNLVLACHACNHAKAATPAPEWFAQHPTAAGAFLLLAGHVAPPLLQAAADACDTPYRETFAARVPVALQTGAWLQTLATTVKAYRS